MASNDDAPHLQSEESRPTARDEAGTGRVVPDLSAGARAVSASLGWLWALIKAIPPSMLGFLSLWIFVFAPWLRPWEPPVERRIAISDLVVGERDKEIDENGAVAHTIFVTIDATGYDADEVDTFWLQFDRVEQERIEDTEVEQLSQTLDFNTRTDQVIAEIDVPVPEDHPGCIFVRVLLRVHPPDEQPGSRLEAVGHALAGAMRWLLGWHEPRPQAPLLLDAADTAPFDPNDPFNPECPQAVTSEAPMQRASELFAERRGGE